MLARRRGLPTAVAALVAGTAWLTAAPTVSADEARPQRAAGGSGYGDPCEGAGSPDLRRVAIGPLLAADGTATRAPVSVEIDLCAALPASGALTLRIDLHRLRADGDDHLETPSGWLRVHREAGHWRTETVMAGAVRATTAVETRPSTELVTSLRTTTDACLLVEAAGGRCGVGRTVEGLPASGLPPLALRACTGDTDCGPGWRTEHGAVVRDASAPVAGVDYLPEPDHLPVTYPSMCQQPASATRVASRHGLRSAPARTPDALPPDPWFPADGPGAPTGQWSLQRVGGPAAWDHTGGAGVSVAVIDSGIDGRHPDLVGAARAVVDVVPGRDGVVVRPLDPAVDSDLQGHGTAVASVLAARSDEVGMTGIAPAASLLVARVFDAEGCASDAAVAAAMRWAADAGATVVTLSLGGPAPAPQLAAAGDELRARGVVLVAAAGNGGGPGVDYPAAYPSFLSVSATGFAAAGDPGEDPVAPYASVDATIDLAAPGGSTTAAEHGVLVGCWRGATLGHGWCRDAGTSFATPLVAGAAALVRATDPARTAAGVRDALLDTTHDLRHGPGRSTGPDPASGSGLLRADRAVATTAAAGGRLQVVAPDSGPVAAAVAASRLVYGDDGAAHAVLARADVLADALAGAPLAGDAGPLLLTTPRELPEDVLAELDRVLPAGRTIYLMGGTGALPTSFADQLRERGWRPERIAGSSRTQTALAAARALRPARGGEVVLASADSWTDGIAAAAHAARLQVPLLLVGRDGAEPLLPALDELRPAVVTIVGGPVAVPAEVSDQLADRFPGRVRRLAGATRYGTAAAVAATAAAGGPPTRMVAVGGEGPDAAGFGLAAVTLVGGLDAPLLLVDGGAEAPGLRWLLHDRWSLRPGRRVATAVTLGPLAGDARREPATRQRLLELVGG